MTSNDLKCVAMDLINLKYILQENINEVDTQLEKIENILNKRQAEPNVSIPSLEKLRKFLPNIDNNVTEIAV